MLAVGREDGLVSLHSVEDGHLLHEFSAGAAITKLHWTQQSEERLVGILYDRISYKFGGELSLAVWRIDQPTAKLYKIHQNFFCTYNICMTIPFSGRVVFLFHQ